LEADAVDVATLPPFSNQRGCPQFGARHEIRVHFDRDCALVRGERFHRLCRCGHERSTTYASRVSEAAEQPNAYGVELGELFDALGLS
jgi:hypothetical protein